MSALDRDRIAAASAPESFLEAPVPPAIFNEHRRRGGLRGALHRHPSALFGLAIIGAMVFMAVFAPLLTPSDPTLISPLTRLKSPGAEWWFGTDALGRDLYARVIYGARVSLLVGFSVALFSAALGLLIGLVSGFVRWTDGVLMRMMDGLMSIPGILLAIALMALSGGSIFNVILAITIIEIPRVARLVRSVVLSLREQPYVEAAIAAGTRPARIVVRHILPNTIAPLTVQSTYICAAAMLIEAILSFIGAGVPPTIPSWGNIMADGKSLWQLKPYLVFIPAVFLSLTILAVNMVGDGLRDALDPRMARRL